MRSPFAVTLRRVSVADRVLEVMGGGGGNAVSVVEFERPALVVGPTQTYDLVDDAACEAAGVAVVRRRGGGGAVLLDPDDVVWIDVDLERSDMRWESDLQRSGWWLGRVWARALVDLGVVDATVSRIRRTTPPLGRLVCFAGVSPGEVVRGERGPKAVGVCQHRSLHGARFQCAVPLRWDPARLLSLLRFDAEELQAVAGSIDCAVAPVDRSAGEVVDAFLDALAEDGDRDGGPE